MLEVWRCVSTHTYVVSENIPFSSMTPFILLVSAFFMEKVSVFVKNIKVFWCFQGVEKGCIGNKWVKLYAFFQVFVFIFMFQIVTNLRNLIKNEFPLSNVAGWSLWLTSWAYLLFWLKSCYVANCSISPFK